MIMINKISQKNTMKIKSIKLEDFKRFTNLTIDEIPETTKLVILTGPNGCGKSSVFDAFLFWSNMEIGQGGFEREYYAKSKEEGEDIQSTLNRINIKIYGDEIEDNFADSRKNFYIRSAHRHETNFQPQTNTNKSDVLKSNNKIYTLMQQESRLSENCNWITTAAIEELFMHGEETKTKEEIKEKIIGKVRASMEEIFSDLILYGFGDPINGRTLRFDKGNTPDFHFKNLSSGEKAAFDLLLDFIIKREAFNNTIFCIDEPELHMHTQLQAKLLKQLFKLTPDNCQLWIATHSIGMVRAAADLYKKNKGEVAFIDFHGDDKNFDNEVRITPQKPTPAFWASVFKTTLGDLSELVVPKNIVFCEGKKETKKDKNQEEKADENPSFDATIYNKIFSLEYPETRFMSLGGETEVQKVGNEACAVLEQITRGATFSKLIDRDDLSTKEIEKHKKKNTRVLKMRTIESYLWADEILEKLAEKNSEIANLAENLKNEKLELLKKAQEEDKKQYPKKYKEDLNYGLDEITSDIKKICYNLCKFYFEQIQKDQKDIKIDVKGFLINTLAPLITEDTKIYQELKEIIFGEI